MEERLKYIFNNINDWLKFAETKNAALLVIDSAAIFALLSFINSADSINQYVVISLYATIALLLLSIFVLLFSFVLFCL
jgi:hypothetical protein